MRPAAILVLFAMLLALATGLSYLGYNYLTLASQYRERNFLHLSHTDDALALLRANPAPRPETARQIRDHVTFARAQADWCLRNLSNLELVVFERMGAGQALQICRNDLATADDALALIALLERAETIAQTGSNSAFSLGLRVAEAIDTMRTNSLEFRPQVASIEKRLVRLVKTGTLGATVLIAGLFALLAHTVLRVWSQQDARTRDLQRLSQRFTGAMQASEDGFAIFDTDLRLIDCNLQYRRLCHSDPDAVKPGMSKREILFSAIASGHYADTEGSAEQHLKEFLEDIADDKGVSERQYALSGDRFVLSRVSRTELGDIVVTRTDITSIVRAEQAQRRHAEALEKAKTEIERQSLTDPLTGLPNRRKLDTDLAERIHEGPLVLIRIDLDRFKQVNDVLGHDAGDFVLCHVARLMDSALRPGDLPARVGGDEFVILCRPDTAMDDARQLAQTLLAEILKPVAFDNKHCLFGASFGIAETQDGLVQPSDLLSAADAALYRAKASGRGTVEVFSRVMRKEMLRDRALADRFAKALETQEIQPYVQTQHNAKDGSLAGVEVLARWEHPTDGVLLPHRFMPIARQLGLEAKMDETIFQQAVTSVAKMAQDGVIVPRIAFNVSAARISDPGFLASAREAIPTNRERFAFEILESISYEDSGPGLIFAVDALKDLGFQIDIDDFGSGHASINSVLKLEPHVLKIDKSITRPLGDSERAARMVASIIELARALDAKVLAEGVDSEIKATLLRDMGCDMLQGYFFSRPAPMSRLHATLRDNGDPNALTGFL